MFTRQFKWEKVAGTRLNLTLKRGGGEVFKTTVVLRDILAPNPYRPGQSGLRK